MQCLHCGCSCSPKRHQVLVFDPERPWDFHWYVIELCLRLSMLTLCINPPPPVPACPPHCSVADSKGVVTHLEWSADDTRLLVLDQSSIIHVWRMKVWYVVSNSLFSRRLTLDCHIRPTPSPSTLQSHCINNWVCASKQEPTRGAELVHAAWLDHKPMVHVCTLRVSLYT